MSGRYQVEVLLRPAVEIYSATTMFALATVAWMMPTLLFMPVPVARGTAFVLFLLGVKDSVAGYRILAYRRRMREVPRYSMSFGKIPKSSGSWFLGRGFRWTHVNTQRMLDTYEDRYGDFITVADNLDRHAVTRRVLKRIPVIGSLADSRSIFNPFRPMVQLGGNPALHGVGTNVRDVFIGDKAREGNMLVLGTTGAGKTRTMELFLAQDIQHSNRDVVIVIDPKGDGDLLRRIYIEAARSGRTEDVTVFHLGFPEFSARYNGVGSFARITEVATRIANQLPSEGNAAAFREFSWRFVNVAARALTTLGRRVSYRDIQEAIDDIEPLLIEYAQHVLESKPDLQILLSEIQENVVEVPRDQAGRRLEGYQLFVWARDFAKEIDDDVLVDLSAVYKYDKTYYDKLVSSVGPLLEKLTSGKAGELLSPDYLDDSDNRDILDWRDVIRRRGIVYVGLDALSDSTVSAAVGQTMLADLTAVAGSMYKHGTLPGFDTEQPRVLMHFDEVNELIADAFVPMVNKCRGAGMLVTAYTQTVQDIEAKVGSSAKSGQIIGNFNHLIMMRVRNRETAEIMTEQTPMVSVQKIMAVTGANDSEYGGGGNVFTSSNEDRVSSEQVRMIEPSMLMQLPNGHAFGQVEGGRLYKLVFPMPIVAPSDPIVPDDVASLIQEMNSFNSGDPIGGEDRWWLELGHGS